MTPTLNWPKQMAMYGAVELTCPQEVLEDLPPRHRILEVIPMKTL
jgi:hypothetical protein